jgi:diphthamide biosynthesis protein 3
MPFYEEVELEDFSFDESTATFTYPCPCGDNFEVSLCDLIEGEDVARCPSCSLIVRVIYEPVSSVNCLAADIVGGCRGDFTQDEARGAQHADTGYCDLLSENTLTC